MSIAQRIETQLARPDASDGPADSFGLDRLSLMRLGGWTTLGLVRQTARELRVRWRELVLYAIEILEQQEVAEKGSDVYARARASLRITAAEEIATRYACDCQRLLGILEALPETVVDDQAEEALGIRRVVHSVLLDMASGRLSPANLDALLCLPDCEEKQRMLRWVREGQAAQYEVISLLDEARIAPPQSQSLDASCLLAAATDHARDLVKSVRGPEPPAIEGTPAYI